MSGHRLEWRKSNLSIKPECWIFIINSEAGLFETLRCQQQQQQRDRKSIVKTMTYNSVVWSYFMLFWWKLLAVSGKRTKKLSIAPAMRASEGPEWVYVHKQWLSRGGGEDEGYSLILVIEVCAEQWRVWFFCAILV